MTQTAREMPVFTVVALDAWRASWAARETEPDAMLEPLDPTEWGGASVVSGYDTTCVAGKVLS